MTACEHCLSRGLRCVQEPPEGGYYALRRDRLQEIGAFQETLPRESQSNSSTYQSEFDPSPIPCMTLRLELVNLYFEYIHDQFHSIYHRPSFIEDVASERAPKIVLFAMLALSSRFSVNEAFARTDPRDRGEIYRLASERLLNIRNISPTTVQACVLLGAYAAASGETDVENLYYGLAGRMCLALDLPNRPVASLLERELNIRCTYRIINTWQCQP